MDFTKLLEEVGPELLQLLNSKAISPAANPENVISSGVLAVDMKTGIGGFPRDRIIEVYSQEGAGKTTLALHTCAEYNKEKKKAVYIDFEHALDPGYALDVGIKPELFSLSQPETGEEGLELAIKASECDDVGIVVIDSVAGIVSKQELEGELLDNNLGVTARLMGKACRKLKTTCKQHKTLCFFINQLREKIGVMFGNPNVTPGGKALKFFSSIRIEMYKAAVNKENSVSVSNETRFKIVKNKLGPPWQEGSFNLVYGKGADNIKTLIKEGVALGFFAKKGSIFEVNGEKIKGEKAFKKWLKSKENKKQTNEWIKEAGKATSAYWKEQQKKAASSEISVTEKQVETVSKMPSMLED